jgi:hypothetical protein
MFYKKMVHSFANPMRHKDILGWVKCPYSACHTPCRLISPFLLIPNSLSSHSLSSPTSYLGIPSFTISTALFANNHASGGNLPVT